MYLYDLPRDKDIEIHGLEPNGDKDGVIIFGHLDGMYSYCWIKGQPNKVVHLAAAMPLKKVGDHYEADHEE